MFHYPFNLQQICDKTSAKFSVVCVLIRTRVTTVKKSKQLFELSSPYIERRRKSKGVRIGSVMIQPCLLSFRRNSYQLPTCSKRASKKS